MGDKQHQLQKWFIRTILALTLALIGSQTAQEHQHPKGKAHHVVKKSVPVESEQLNPNRHTLPSSKNEEVRGGSVSGEAEAGKTNAVAKLEKSETDAEADEAKQQTTRDSFNDVNLHDKHGDRSGGRGGGRFIIKNLWDVCCNETESEVKELDTILKKLGLPSVNYSKTKAYELTDYDFAPDIQSCKSKDFLDFYVFPYLLPAIQALIQFARVNRVFQCRFCTFNALDYIVEYLYNNNPRYPDRLENPVPIFEIPFAKTWLEKHPRKPPPKWMLMTSEEAAIIIQRAIRGYMVRCRPEVQEMRQFWRDFRTDLEEEKNHFHYGKSMSKHLGLGVGTIYSPYYEEYRGEFEESCGSPCLAPIQMAEGGISSPIVSHHSDHCVYCQAFRKFLDNQTEETLKSYQRYDMKMHSSTDPLSPVNADQPTRHSADNNEEMGVSATAEGLTIEHNEEAGGSTDTGGENEDTSGKGTRKESKPSAGQLPEAVRSNTSSKNPKTPHKAGHSVVQKSFTVANNTNEKKKEKKGKRHATD